MTRTNDYRMKGFLEMSKRVQKKCTLCDHYYDMVKAGNGRFVRGHFCIHWPDILCLSYDNDFMKNAMYERVFKEADCIYYRNRNINHPLNSLRKNKEYFDLNGADCSPLL